MPLLTAPWYVQELERRHRLVGGSIEGTELDVARRIADRARAIGRPVAVSLTVPKTDRDSLGLELISVGLVALDRRQAALTANLESSWSLIPIAVEPTAKARETIERWRAGRDVHPSVDPVHEYFQDVLSCPRLALEKPPNSLQLAKLDSLCNLR
jgi:hypothetical protein